MKLVGLTGGIACGKSTVSQMLVQHGIPVIDCDEIAHAVVTKGRWGYKRVVRAFREHPVLAADGQLDREALAEIVFSDSQARRRLNAATHLPVLLGILQQLALHWLSFRPVAVVDMPLLFETGFFRVARPNVLVTCRPGVQLNRIVQRDGLQPQAAAARIAAQMPLEQKRQLASIVLDNSGDMQHLRVQVQELAGRLQRGTWLHRTLLSPAGVVLAAAALAKLCF